jgi:hypothetical protein
MEGWNSLHDTVFDATGADLNETQLKRVFSALPDSIRAEARKYGLGDTDARGEIGMWLRRIDYEFVGKTIEDIEPCELTFRFASITDMVAFVKMAQNFDNDKVGVRGRDALDDGKCSNNRKFVASEEAEGGSRLTVVKKEIETV